MKNILQGQQLSCCGNIGAIKPLDRFAPPRKKTTKHFSAITINLLKEARLMPAAPLPVLVVGAFEGLGQQRVLAARPDQPASDKNSVG